MKIAVLYGNMPQNDCGLGLVMRIVRETLAELEIETEEINLGYSQVPYFDGIKSQAADDVMRRLGEASGVIIACTAQLFAPTAIMQTFIEYFQLDDYNGAFKEKHCFLITVSKNGGERSVLEYLSKFVQFIGGFDSAQLGLQEVHTRGIETDAEIRAIIERETEDYYRVLRQNRKRIIPRDYAVRERLANMTGADVVTLSAPGDKKEKIPASQVYQRLNLDAFTEQQEKDIQELTRFFAVKYATSEEAESEEPKPAPKAKTKKVVPRERTVKQITQSLPHYYQPQLSQGLTALMQFCITGEETFEGYLTIRSTECEYFEGSVENPDITILAETGVWNDVLKNKCTAQKAFMIGGLKVRGNFVLLTKFDTLFKLGEN